MKKTIFFNQFVTVDKCGCRIYLKQLYYHVAVSSSWLIFRSDCEILALIRVPSSGSIAIMHQSECGGHLERV